MTYPDEFEPLLVDINNVRNVPPGSILNHRFQNIDILGIVVSNHDKLITVFWPHGHTRLKTYDLNKTSFITTVVSRVL